MMLHWDLNTSRVGWEEKRKHLFHQVCWHTKLVSESPTWLGHRWQNTPGWRMATRGRASLRSARGMDTVGTRAVWRDTGAPAVKAVTGPKAERLQRIPEEDTVRRIHTLS